MTDVFNARIEWDGVSEVAELVTSTPLQTQEEIDLMIAQLRPFYNIPEHVKVTYPIE